MVLIISMVLTLIHGIALVLLNQTRTRGLSVARVRDFLLKVLAWLHPILPN